MSETRKYDILEANAWSKTKTMIANKFLKLSLSETQAPCPLLWSQGFSMHHVQRADSNHLRNKASFLL